MNKSTTQLLKLISTTTDMNSFLESNHFEFIDENFTDMLKMYLERSKLTKYQVLKDSEIDSNYGYQIFNGRRKPNRNKVIQLSLALNVTLKEMQLLLLSVNERQLYVRDKRDSIIMYAIEKKSTVLDLESYLLEYKEELLIK